MLTLTLLEWLASLVAGGSVVVSTAVGVALLVRRQGQPSANVAMGLLLLVAATAVLHELILNVRPAEAGWTLIFLPLLYTYAFGPLLYTYVHARLNGPRPLSRWHYVLPVLQAILTIGMAVSPVSVKTTYMQAIYAPWYSTVEDIIFTVSFTVYLFLSYQAVKQAQKRVRFDWERHRYQWLRRLVGGSAIILGVSVSFNIAGPVLYFTTGANLYQYEWAAFAENIAYSALLYWMALGGFVQAIPPLQRVVGPSADAPVRKESYNLSSGILAEYRVALERLMAEQCPYLDADLTLATLADQLGVTDKVLSYVLNEGLGVSYADYVNGLRVEEATQRLADPATAHLTVLGIGLDAGFASKATFNRVFKRTTGQTPSEYRKQARLQSS